MPRRGHSTTVGKFAKFYQDRRASEIRVLGELLRGEQRAASEDESETQRMREGAAAR
ncbi:hypothetical protein ABT346_28745 [Micromonospora peucetia]|uniref:hypothetical protein n=1 Tax=Micromonospora peucetia TaxID=47871 RepID=UPI003324C04C